MANDDRTSERYRDRNRGMFGYEGEGYMAGGENRDRNRGDRYSDDYRTGFSGGYGGGTDDADRDPMVRGYRDLESGADRGWNIGRDTDRGDRPQRQSYRGRGPKNYQRSDDRIHEDVCERLAMDHDVDASEIEVTVQGGVVTLDGTVNERYAKRMAEDIAESVRGVKDVQNNLRVSR